MFVDTALVLATHGGNHPGIAIGGIAFVIVGWGSLAWEWYAGFQMTRRRRRAFAPSADRQRDWIEEGPNLLGQFREWRVIYSLKPRPEDDADTDKWRIRARRRLAVYLLVLLVGFNLPFAGYVFERLIELRIERSEVVAAAFSLFHMILWASAVARLVILGIAFGNGRQVARSNFVLFGSIYVALPLLGLVDLLRLS